MKIRTYIAEREYDTIEGFNEVIVTSNLTEDDHNEIIKYFEGIGIVRSNEHDDFVVENSPDIGFKGSRVFPILVIAIDLENSDPMKEFKLIDFMSQILETFTEGLDQLVGIGGTFLKEIRAHSFGGTNDVYYTVVVGVSDS